MKKLASLILIIAILGITAVPCLAEESGKTNIDILAKYVDEVKDGYKAQVNRQKAEVTLPDNVTVKADNVTEDGIFLVVIPVEKADADAYSWFEACLNNYGTNAYTMDIYFVDSYGNRVEKADGTVITVTLPDGYNSPIICSTAKDGTTAVVDSTVSGKSITFTADNISYYSIVEKKTAEATTTDKAKEEDKNTPKTGYNSHMVLWSALFILSTASLSAFGISKKLGKQSHQD